MNRLVPLVTLVGGMTLVGSALGYVRNSSIASVFGISGQSDAYFVAIFLPMTLQVILVSGSLAPALLHVYIGYQQRGHRRDAEVTFSTLLNLLALVLALFVLVGVIFRDQLVSLTAPGLPEDSAQLSARLMLLTLPSLLLLGTTALLGPLLNAHDHFFMPALGPALYNLLTIGVLLAAERYVGIEAAAAGGLAGASLQMLLLVIVMRRRGIAYSPVLSLRHPGVRRALLASAPVVGYLLVAYASIWLERLFASMLEAGTVSIITIAMTIFVFPNTVFNGSLGTVVYPTLVRQGAAGAAGAVEMASSVLSAIRLLMLVLIPATVLMVVAATPLTRIAYGPGAADDADVHTGGLVLAVYTVGLLAVGVAGLVQQVMYATGRFMMPLKIELASLGVYAPLAALLSYSLGAVGLGLARLASFLSAGILSLLTAWRMGLLPPLGQVVAGSTKPLVGAAAMAGAYLALSGLSERVISSTGYAGLLLEQASLFSICAGVYLSVGALLGIEGMPRGWRSMLGLVRPPGLRRPAYAVLEASGSTPVPQEEA